MNKIKHGLTLLASVIGIELLGSISGILAGNSDSIYQNLKLPPLSPESIIFPIMWTILYALIGVSLYFIVVQPKSKLKSRVVQLFIAQMFFNFIWSLIFFNGYFWISLIIITLLDVSVVMLMTFGKKLETRIFWILLPYLLWISFATYLTVVISFTN